jgi:hypothetical protein
MAESTVERVGVGMNKSRRILAAIAAGVTIAGAAGFIAARSYEDRETARMVTVADHFRAPAAWQPQDNLVRPEQLLCVGDTACPSLMRTWQADTAITPQSLRELAGLAGWNVSVEGDCRRQSNWYGFQAVCTAVTFVDGFRVDVQVGSTDDQAPQTVQLHLEPVAP